MVRDSAVAASRAAEEKRCPTEDVLRLDQAEIAAVEAFWPAAEQKELSGAKDMAALPTRQWSLLAIRCQSASGENAADKDVATMSADPVAACGGDRFQEVCRAREVFSGRGKHSHVGRQLHDREIAKVGHSPPDPIETGWSAGGYIPNEQRASLAHGRRNHEGERKHQTPVWSRHQSFRPEDDRRRVCSSHCFRSARW